MSRSTLWRALHEDLKPVRAPRLTAENRLARLNFCRDVLQRVGVLSVCDKRHLEPLDLTRVVFSDEKILLLELHWTRAEQPNLGGWSPQETGINEHSQPNPSTVVGAAMVNGIVFPPCFIEEGVRINTECYIRMLDDVYLPHCMARLGTDTCACDVSSRPRSH